MPDSVELRYHRTEIMGRVLFWFLLAVAVSLLGVMLFLETLLQAAARFGETRIVVLWLLILAGFAAAVWWQSRAFDLCADENGLYHSNGFTRRSVRWSQISSAIR